MMDAYTKYPTSIEVDDKEYEILTDFRDWIRFMDMMKAKDLLMNEKAFLMQAWFKNEIPPVKGMMEGLIHFMNQDNGEPKRNQKKQKKRVVDFVLDADYIAAGFLQAYGVDLSEIEYMHFYKFLSLFRALPSDTEIMNRIKYRSMDAGKIKDREERARIRQIQMEIDLPQEELTDEEIANAFL